MPEDFMKFSEIVDLNELQHICDSFTAIIDAANAIIDLDGNVLTATGWEEICTRYHRVNPITACRCQESDTVLASKLKAGESYNVYRCKNGLIDVAVPIFVEGEHVANFFTGQFLFEPPDITFFYKKYIKEYKRMLIYAHEIISVCKEIRCELSDSMESLQSRFDSKRSKTPDGNHYCR